MIDKILIPFLTKSGFNSELVPYYCGLQHCATNHSWGPGIRDHFLIHYITDGFGILKTNGIEYNLRKGQLFLISPDVITFYQAHETTPWTYLWIGFYGLKAEEFLKRAGLSHDKPIISYNKDNLLLKCMSEMQTCEENKKYGDIKFTGLLYDFLSQLIENNNEQKSIEDTKHGKEQYYQKALEFINMNYSRKISISGVAKYIGIDRKYHHYIFKAKSGMSPQKFFCRLYSDQSWR